MKSNMIKCWFLLVLLALAACQEKEELASTAKGSVSLKATIESDGTRTSVDEEGHVSWVETDAIGVFGEETRNAKFQSISSGSSVFFVGEMSSRQDIPTLAYYPYDENAVLDGNTLHFTLPSEYQYTGESNAPMLGIKQADGDFMFKHLCGLLKVTIKNMPENAKRLFVVSEGMEEKVGPAITGNALVNDITASNATLSITKNEGHEVSIDLKNTSAQETYTFFIPIPVGEYPKLSVKLEMNDGVIYMDKSVSDVKMVRAMMLDMPLIDLLEKKPDLGENMVLGDNTVLLTEDFIKYVSTKVIDGTIILDANIPESKLPQIGKILFYGEVSDKFPSGFLGKVAKIEKVNNRYKIETTPVSLVETFDVLYINQDFSLNLDLSEVVTRGIVDSPLASVFETFEPTIYEDVNGYKGLKIYTHINTRPLNEALINEKEHYPGVGLEFDLGKRFKVHLSTSTLDDEEYLEIMGNLIGAVKPNILIDINKEKGKNIFDISFNRLIKADSRIIHKGKIDFSINITMSLPVDIIKIENLGSISLSGDIGFYFDSSLDCDVCIDTKFESVKISKLGLSDMSYNVLPQTPLPATISTDIKSVKYWEGSKSFGMIGDLSIEGKLLGTLGAEASVTFKEGPIFRSNLGKGIDIGAIDLYNYLNDKYLETALKLELAASVKGKLGILSDKYDIYAFAEKTWPWSTYEIDKFQTYYVPQFKINNFEDKVLGCSASYNVEREMAVPINLSLSLLNDDDEHIAESESMKYYYQEDAKDGLNASFEGLSPFMNYSIRPTIELADWGKFYASPIEEKKGVGVLTKNFWYNGDNSIVCVGEIINVIDKELLTEYGICYKKQDDTVSSYISSDYITDENLFEVELSNLSAGIYEYKAYVKIGDELCIADETKTFEIDSESSITTTQATNITQTTATLSGNIQGYEADDFGHRYGIIYSTDANPTASNGTIVYSNNIQEDGNYSVNVASLVKNTTYYYRAFVVNGGNYLYGEVMNFKTINEPSLRDALIELYKTTNGDNWINNDNWCSDKPLTEWYGISVNTWSEKLHIDLSGNNLTGFVDFKAETTEESHIFSNVGRLYFNDNNLTSIDISGIRGVNVLDCAGNPLSSVLSVNCPDLSIFNCDERNYEQSSKVDKKIDLSNCSMLNSINCAGSNIVELKIDGCSSLQYLMCDENKLTSIDFTGCDAIYNINLRDNNLVSLDLGNKLGLKQLSVLNNKLTTINVIGCTSLEFIAASYNELTSISLSGLSALTEAQFNYNLISDVSIENCVSLKCLLLDNNKLQKLDVSGMESLTGLFIRNNSISELNVDGCLNLEAIYANSNKLATLDLSGYAKLKTLYCHNNNMVSLNLDGCSALKSLHCVGNKLTEMNVEHCTQLEELECGNNEILKEITEFFMNLKYFKYDRRYDYIEQDDGSIKIKDRRVGWWYEGEPEKLEHKP